jgi:hypothetical protein
MARQISEEGVSEAVGSYRDLEDGVEDGIVSMPLPCDLDPAQLAAER